MNDEIDKIHRSIKIRQDERRLFASSPCFKSFLRNEKQNWHKDDDDKKEETGIFTYATKMHNMTFFENPCFAVFYHISGHIWARETYNTSN